MTRAFLFRGLLVVALSALTGCAMLVQRASDRFADQLGAAILNSDDPATVRDGLPAYLLLLDGLIQNEAEDAHHVGALYAAAELYGAYAGNFTGEDRERAQRLAGKAQAYARRGLCAEANQLCARLDGDFDTFESAMLAVPAKQVGGLYALAAAWAGYIQTNSDNWEAIADLPKVERLLLRVLELDPDHASGLPKVYLGVLNSLRPEAVGGKPEQGRAYFEAAISQSGGRNLYAKTLMAEFYTRLVFDQALHDQLLGEVVAADPKVPGFTLMNVLAQQRAKALLESGKDFF